MRLRSGASNGSFCQGGRTIEYFTTTLGFGFRALPEMFEDWTGLTRQMISADFPDILTEYAEEHPEVRWVDYGSARKSPESIEYYIMAKSSIRYCDGLIPSQIDLPSKSYERELRESIHKLNVKEEPAWHIGLYEW